MIILYILLIAYIVAINFYSFLLVKTLHDEDRKSEIERQAAPLTENTAAQTSKKTTNRPMSKLFIAGALGGAITIYVCMFLFKYRRADLLLMVLMPLLGVLNVYLFVLLSRSGFGFLLIR